MDNALLLRFMIAHIRLYTKENPETWSVQQCIETFATLPHPAVPPDVWAKRMGLSIETPEEKEQQDMALSRTLGAKVMSFVGEHQATFPKREKKEEPVA